MMRRSQLWYGCITALLLSGAACSKGDDAPGAPAEANAAEARGAAEPSAPNAESAAPAIDAAKLAEEIGVEPGGWEADAEAGPDAVVTAATGAVEVRRVGEELFTKAAAGAELRPGDQVRTGADGEATVVLTDETVVELAADTAVAVGDRDASAEPAARVAMLYGIARFSVAPRAEGEGAFLVFTPTGLIGTKGTTYGVGVAATGSTRVGVESGAVVVSGMADLGTSVEVKGGAAAEVSAEGVLGQPGDFFATAWGEWRDAIEASLEPAAVAELHAKALVDLEAEIGGAYGDFEVLASAVGEADAEAEAMAQAGDVKGYAVIAPDLGATVEASYLASLRLEALTFAMLSRAYITHELYARHPAPVRPVYEVHAPRIHGAVLYHKKYHAVAHAHVRPLRVAWWHHHPTGRARVSVHGGTVPSFYAKTKLKPIPAARVSGLVQVPVYRPPSVEVRDHRRKVQVGVPAPNWHASVKVKATPPRAEAGWYVRPAAPRARLVAGLDVKSRVSSAFEVRTPAPRRPDIRIGVARPDVQARMKVKGGVKIGGSTFGTGDARVRGAGRVDVKVPAVPAGAAADVKGRVNTKVKVTAPRAPDVRADVKVKAGDVKGRVDTGAADVKGKVKVQTPAVKVKAPAVDVKGKVDVKAGANAGGGVKTKAPPPPPKPKAPATPNVKAGGSVKGSVDVKAGGGVKIGK